MPVFAQRRDSRARELDGGGRKGVWLDLLAVEGADNAGGRHVVGAGQERLAVGHQDDVVVEHDKPRQVAFVEEPAEDAVANSEDSLLNGWLAVRVFFGLVESGGCC